MYIYMKKMDVSHCAYMYFLKDTEVIPQYKRIVFTCCELGSPLIYTRVNHLCHVTFILVTVFDQTVYAINLF